MVTTSHDTTTPGDWPWERAADGESGGPVFETGPPRCADAVNKPLSALRPPSAGGAYALAYAWLDFTHFSPQIARDQAPETRDRP
jgi:hypothetical protein